MMHLHVYSLAKIDCIFFYDRSRNDCTFMHEEAAAVSFFESAGKIIVVYNK